MGRAIGHLFCQGEKPELKIEDNGLKLVARKERFRGSEVMSLGLRRSRLADNSKNIILIGDRNCETLTYEPLNVEPKPPYLS
jgi:hypothetical protein